MNTQDEKRSQTPSELFLHSEQRQSPHWRSPSTKQVGSNIPGGEKTVSGGRRPLPVALPMARALRTEQARRGKDPARQRSSAAATVEAVTRSRPHPRRALVDVRMAFTILGFSVSAVLVLLFGIDLALAMPFKRVSLLMDVGYLLCGVILAGLSWSCLRDQVG